MEGLLCVIMFKEPSFSHRSITFQYSFFTRSLILSGSKYPAPEPDSFQPLGSLFLSSSCSSGSVSHHRAFCRELRAFFPATAPPPHQQSTVFIITVPLLQGLERRPRNQLSSMNNAICSQTVSGWFPWGWCLRGVGIPSRVP